MKTLEANAKIIIIVINYSWQINTPIHNEHICCTRVKFETADRQSWNNGIYFRVARIRSLHKNVNVQGLHLNEGIDVFTVVCSYTLDRLIIRNAFLLLGRFLAGSASIIWNCMPALPSLFNTMWLITFVCLVLSRLLFLLLLWKF